MGKQVLMVLIEYKQRDIPALGRTVVRFRPFEVSQSIEDRNPGIVDSLIRQGFAIYDPSTHDKLADNLYNPKSAGSDITESDIKEINSKSKKGGKD